MLRGQVIENSSCCLGHLSFSRWGLICVPMPSNAAEYTPTSHELFYGFLKPYDGDGSANRICVERSWKKRRIRFIRSSSFTQGSYWKTNCKTRQTTILKKGVTSSQFCFHARVPCAVVQRSVSRRVRGILAIIRASLTLGSEFSR